MSDNIEEWELVEGCEKFMELGLHKGICLDGNGSSFKGALADFESALQFMPGWGPIMECCGLLKYMLGYLPEAREYFIRADRNKHCTVSARTDQVCRYVWIEFTKWFIFARLLVGNQIQINYEERLPSRPDQFKGVNCEAQVFKGDFHFGLAITRVDFDRNGNKGKVQLSLTLEHARIGVSNYTHTDKFQGYFIHRFDIDVSPDETWSADSQLLSVRSEVGQTSQPIQQQQTVGANAQVGIGGNPPFPNANVTFSSSHSTAFHEFPVAMTASKGIEGNDKAMRSTWEVIRYAEGDPFEVNPVKKIRKLPYSTTDHVCNDSDKFQGKWVVPLDTASSLEYKFPWKIQLKAQFALLPRISRRPWKSVPQPLKYEYAPSVRQVQSDFYSAITEQIVKFN